MTSELVALERNKKYISITVVIIAVFLLSSYLNSDEEVVFSEPQWNCINSDNKWKCTVSFEVINETHTQQIRKASIRAITVSGGGRSNSLKIRGEKLFDHAMAPKETIGITEILFCDRRPGEIKVHIWK